MLCRGEAGSAAFSNHKLRDVVDGGKWRVTTNGEVEGETRKMRERKKILSKNVIGSGEGELNLEVWENLGRVHYDVCPQ